jgi:hypothetical protein
MSRKKSPPAAVEPISEKRLAANRANAQRSTGPRTAEGKARSARNAVKHGFTGSTFAVVRFEDIQEIGNLKADAVACYRPVNAQEMFAVERIALAQHKMLRGHRLESGMLTYAFDRTLTRQGVPFHGLDPDMLEGDIPVTRAQNRNYAVAEGLCDLIMRSRDPLSLLLRYQAQAEREYRRAIEDFERLKALRPEFPNEPIWQEETEENHELATMDELGTNPRDGFTYNPTLTPEAAPQGRTLPPSPASQQSGRDGTPGVREDLP